MREKWRTTRLARSLRVLVFLPLTLSSFILYFPPTFSSTIFTYFGFSDENGIQEEVSCYSLYFLFLSIVRQSWKKPRTQPFCIEHGTTRANAVGSVRTAPKKKEWMIKVLSLEVIYQSQGPSLRAVKHESSGGDVGARGTRKKRRSLRKYPDGRSWETPSFSYTTCICPLCVCVAPKSLSRCQDTDGLNQTLRKYFSSTLQFFFPFFYSRLLLNFKEKVHSFISSSFIFFFLLLVASLSARPSRIFCPVSFWKDNFSLTLSKSQSLTFFSLNFSTYFLPFFHF